VPSAIDGLSIREGHFLLESGLHTATWIDLGSLFLDPQTLAPHIAALATLVSRHQVSAVCGPLLGGAFVAQALALELGVRFYYAERVYSNPRELFQAVYRLPGSQRARATTERFAVVDDVIGAGSSVRATVNELASLGATTAVVGALLTLGSGAERHLTKLGIPVVAPSSKEVAMWEPESCPQCQAGVPLLSVS
jgi:orotate phosphoribosyltransferase